MRPRGRSAADWGRHLAASAKVYKPSGPGPFPVVLQFHGCGGVQPFQSYYAKAANQAGVAAVVVDSFAPRGMSKLDGHLFVCTGTVLRGGQRAADVHGMARWLETQGWADSRRIAAAGWSHGGWTLMDACAQGADTARLTGLTDASNATLERLRGLFLVYPYASFPSLTSSRGWGKLKPQVSAVVCGRDAVVGEKGPRRALDRVSRDGVKVDLRYLPEGTHGFDDDAATDPRTKYRADLSEQARAFYSAFLKRALA